MNCDCNGKLKRYIPIASFLSEILGKNAEVVLQDVTNNENSIIYISNGNISGRKIGSPLTDFALSILYNKSYIEKDFISNYTGKTRAGKILQSSTYFIKEDGEIIGMLCVNIDITNIVDTRNLLDSFINKGNDEKASKLSQQNNVPETFSNNINELVLSIIQSTMLKYNISPERMKPDEKMSFVHELDTKGIFSLKGAIQQVSEYLKTSEATIYRYLNKK